ncbi:SDR family NAD(P)-dependent oxidoreductase [Mycobacterium sp. 48b]|uniref:SDR family NAD(P)-dependent oxidoreductase n=1 Tax=Mycobacterium sp. 48b TaxID=3400426 RepID=UPI003AB04D01
MTPDPTPTASDIARSLDLNGRTFVVTGASSGLGRQSALALAGAGAHVVMAARRPAALAKAQDEIQAQVAHARLTAVELDLASLSSVRAAASTIAKTTTQIDALINNAGVMFTPFGRTSDEFEIQLGTNHLGHFELTRLLLPRLQNGTGARIVNVSSEAHRFGDLDLGDLNWRRRSYDKFIAYGAAKTANILHAVELNRRYGPDGIRAFAVNPGMVATALARHMTRDDVQSVSVLTDRAKQKMTTPTDVLTPDEGAATQVWAATHSDMGNTEQVYLTNCSDAIVAEQYALDPDRAGALWELSAKLCADVHGG